jgi:hypothetical protein
MIDRTPRFALVAIGACVLAGCLNVPDDPEPMCAVSDDCDRAHGEVCEEGTCWGNPPPGPFAAVLSPPSSRRDLVPRELPQVAIPIDGWMGDLALEAPVMLSGRVVAFCPPPMTSCDSTSLAATITVSRSTQFHGGPGFNTVVNVKPGESFAIPVPRTRPGDDLYTVLVVPDGGLQPGGGGSRIWPPLHMELPIGDNIGKTIALGGLGLPTISGRLTDSGNTGLANYRVSALGHWDVTAPSVEVSTVDVTTSTGLYAVTLSNDLAGAVELVARPTAPGSAPMIRVANVELGTATRDIVVPASLGNPVTLTNAIRVTGQTPSGPIAPIRGAVVTVTGTFISGLTTFTVTDEQITSADGNVSLHVLDGAALAGTYRISITPPQSSNLGVMFNQRFTPGQSPAVRLPSRISLGGRILDSRGKPLSNVTVTARPSLRFLWTLEAAPQAFVAAVPASTAVTPNTDSGEGAGRFAVYVDANVSQTWGHYDLLIEPPAGSRAPAYVQADVEIPRDASLESVALGDIAIPAAAYVHGRITGPSGDPVENGELRLYRVETALGLCSEVAHPPMSCPIPALLQARGMSDGRGDVRLALPR